MTNRFNRRNFLKLAVTGAVFNKVVPVLGKSSGPAVQSDLTSASSPGVDTLSILATGTRREWLGPNFWGNRLQDWLLNNGRIECNSDEKGPDLRTVSVLTREFNPANAAGTIRVKLGRISPKGKGFGGFLIGAGAGKIDYRAAALVQKASGQNGGMLCVVDTDGVTSFREHTDEDNFFKYAEIPSETVKGAGSFTGQDVELTLEIKPDSSGDNLTLILSAGDGENQISTSTLKGIKAIDLQGGLMLVSASTSGPEGARYWFSNLTTEGEKISVRPERALGPVLGTLYSLNGNVMKMTAQLMPVADTDSQEVTLSVRENDNTTWRELAKANLSAGYCAQFRITDWDDSKDWQYRVSYADDGTGRGQPAYYDGVVVKDPRHTGRKLSIGLYSCVAASARSLDGGGGRRQLPLAQELGRYTKECLYFPYTEIVSAARHHNPDLFLFVGDQFYENNPTVKVHDEAPLLDYLYKYYLWLWSYRDLTRNRPTLVLVDDHDMYHGNLWGNGGRPAPEGDQDRGGYVRKASWVNMVQNTQCGHNPDPYDPTPVKQGITVYYCGFKYGGVDFCLLEDRKFKTCPVEGASLDAHVGELLGDRQEKFIKEWGEKAKEADARICITATLFGTVQTSPDGQPIIDFDSNGYPPLARDHAVRLLREANVLILSGDQHLASVVRLGDETFTDGPIQFCGPAGSTAWTRWFEPAGKLPNAGDTANTGDFQDGYGNRMRVLAVANPSISFAEYRKYIKGRSQGIGDRNLKAEGYGIVKVDLDAREYTMECWRWDTDPAAAGASQYAGWPMKVGFDEVAKG